MCFLFLEIDYINWWISELLANLVMSLYSGTSQQLSSAYHPSCCHLIYYEYQWHTTFVLWITKSRRLCGQSWAPACLNWSNSKTILGNQAQRETALDSLELEVLAAWCQHIQQHVTTAFVGSAGPAGRVGGKPGYVHASHSPPSPGPYGWKSLVKIRSNPRSNSPYIYTPELVCQLLMSNCNYTFKAFLKTCSPHLAYQCLLR